MCRQSSNTCRHCSATTYQTRNVASEVCKICYAVLVRQIIVTFPVACVLWGATIEFAIVSQTRLFCPWCYKMRAQCRRNTGLAAGRLTGTEKGRERWERGRGEKNLENSISIQQYPGQRGGAGMAASDSRISLGRQARPTSVGTKGKSILGSFVQLPCQRSVRHLCFS